MRALVALAFMAALLATGCASKVQVPPPAYKDTYAAKTRFFSGISKDELFAAAEQVFLAADGDDFEFSYNKHKTGETLAATRDWFVFLVLAAGSGTDTWIFTVTEEDGELKGDVAAYTENTVSDGSIYGTKQRSGALLTVASGNLFWDRVDYFLGRRADWPSCSEREDELEHLKDDDSVNHEYWYLSALCHISMKDTDPETGISTNE